MNRSLDEYDADPDVPDLCDPEAPEEMFLLLKMMHFGPNDLIDRDLAVLYAQWLERTTVPS